MSSETPGSDASTTTQHLANRREVIVLQADPARLRRPAATVWRLRTYDDATQTAVSDLARTWRPEPPRLDGTVPPPVVEWVTTVLGPNLAISVPASYAGPHAWHVHPATQPHT